MAVIDTINVGGADYSIQDATARTNATSALNRASMKMGIYTASTDMEHGTTFSKARPKNSYFTWTGYSDPNVSPAICRTLKAVTAGEAIRFNDTCNLLPIVDNLIYTQNVYVGTDKKLHYKNVVGADAVLNFSNARAPFSVAALAIGGTNQGEYEETDVSNYSSLTVDICAKRDSIESITNTTCIRKSVNSSYVTLWTFNANEPGYVDNVYLDQDPWRVWYNKTFDISNATLLSFVWLINASSGIPGIIFRNCRLN